MKKIVSILVILLLLLVTVTAIAHVPENSLANVAEENCDDCDPAPSRGTPEYDDCLKRGCLPCHVEA